MERVVAVYRDQASAEHAVRGLEQSGFSIQDFSISDESRRVWRRLRPAWLGRSRGQTARWGFLLAAALTFVVAQVTLRTALLPSALSWLGLCAICLVGGCVGSALSLSRSVGGPREPTGFYVILRSDADTMVAVQAQLAKLASA